ncbi:aldo/keto reductase [Bacteroidota bacterium]
MEYRQCGTTDMKFSVLGFGCWSFGGGDYWGETSQKDVNDVVKTAFDNGINYYDTAELYNEGRSEESLGIAIRELPREELIIGSKVSPSNAYYDKLIDHCNASLKRLKTNYMDVYMIHWPIHSKSMEFFTDDPEVINNPPTLQEAVEALKHLRKQGKIRHIGVSNFAPYRMKHILNLDKDIAVNQLSYNLYSRAIEFDILPFCIEKGIGVITYSVLMQGILADLYKTIDDIPLMYRRTRHFNSATNTKSRHGEPGFEDELMKEMADVRKIVSETGISMSDLAISWSVSNKDITTFLIGTRSVNRLKSNINAVNMGIGDELVTTMTEISDTLKDLMGSGFDYYEGLHNDRTI